jgi:hypothetical protein
MTISPNYDCKIEPDPEVELLKLKVLDFLILNDFKGAEDCVYNTAPLLGPVGSKAFVDKVKKEVGI